MLFSYLVGSNDYMQPDDGTTKQTTKNQSNKQQAKQQTKQQSTN